MEVDKAAELVAEAVVDVAAVVVGDAVTKIMVMKSQI